MRRLRAVWRRVLALVRRDRLDRDLAAELQSHLQMHVDDGMRAGMSAADARRHALVKLGGFTQVEQRYREQRDIPMLEHVVRDVRFGARALAKTPGLTFAAVLTLGLGLGATTAIFGFVNAALLRPLPVERPDELVMVNRSGSLPTHSFPDYIDVRDRNRVLSGLVALRLSPMSLGGGSGPPVRTWGYLATGNYFEVLGVRAALGRTFTAADDLAPGAHPLVVLADGFWRRHFGGNPAIVGQDVAINGRPFMVLGVMPPQFRGTEFFFAPDVWVPMMMQEQIESGNAWLNRRGTHNVFLLGRRRPGITSAEAESSLSAIAIDLAREHPALNEGMRLTLSPVGLAGNLLRAPVIGFSGALLALAGLVLLLACINLTGLLLARATDRQRQIAICVALGAGRGTLLRQALVESGLLAIMSTGVALLFTLWVGTLFSRLRLPIDVPLSIAFGLDHRVLMFALALAAVTTLLVGLVPALSESRADVIATLRDETARWAHGWYVRDAVVVAQVALSTVLLIGSLLVGRSLQQATRVDIGFNPEGAVAVKVDLGLQGYDGTRGRAFHPAIIERLSAVPGILSASTANSLPLSLDQSTHAVHIEGGPELRGSNVPHAIYYQVAPDFFRTLEMRLVAGRDFDRRDTRDSPRVAIVNEAFADRLFKGASALGRRFGTGAKGPWIEIVGVVQNGKYQSLGETPRPVAFHPIAQWYNPTTTVVARASIPAGEALDVVRRVVRETDPALSVFDDGPLSQLLALPLLPLRVAAVALTAFGALAIVLVSVGIWALVSYAVSRRTREICIRLAVGASRLDIVRLVLVRTVAIWAVGVGVGVVLAFLGSSLLAPLLLRVDPRALDTFAAAAATLAIVAAAATWFPARRALAADPAALFRRE